MKNKRPRTVDALDWSALEYAAGFHNYCTTEAVAGTLPIGQNSPQHVKFGLYAEQLSGTAFTCPRSTNRRSWLYRLSPSSRQGGYRPAKSSGPLLTAHFPVVDPSPRRWSPLPLAPTKGAPVDFIDGAQSMCGAGDPSLKEGVAIHMYACNKPMADRAFCNADGEMLLVPQQGVLHVTTELGKLRVAPGEIAVLPRNVRFSIDPQPEESAAGCRGYVLEVYASRGFVLPELGPIGANGLAEPRDFQTPVASFEDRHCPDGFTIVTKYAGELFESMRDHSPYGACAGENALLALRKDTSAAVSASR